MRSKKPVRPLVVVRGQAGELSLLRAVAAGEVVRGAGGDTSIFAEHLWSGENVRLPIVRLAADELVELPISGPPRLAPRGRAALGLGNE